MQRHLTIVNSLLITGLGFVAATFGEEPVRDHDITPEDYFTMGVITGCSASPDGRYVAYTETRWEPPAEKRNADLWVVETNPLVRDGNLAPARNLAPGVRRVT